MGKMIGIDLGTTNSAVGIVEGPRPRVLDNKDGKPQTPSVVGLRRAKRRKGGKDELLIGETALDNFPAAPADTIVSIKRLMGRGFNDAEVRRMVETGRDGRQRYLYQVEAPEDGTADSLRVTMGGKPYSAPEISAMILKRLKQDAEFRLGGEVTHAVVTVPAYFTDAQKAATREAANLAGLRVIKLLDEPTAAAVAYGVDAEGGDDDSKTMLVYDLGGGTFDISVLVVYGGTFAPLALEGDMWLGGDDLHSVLIEHVTGCLEDDYGVDLAAQPEKTRMRFQAALTRAAQRAKETLSSSESAHIVVPGLLRDADDDLVDVEETITRSQYEAMIRPLVQRTVELTQKALDEASLTKEDVDYVLMAGGSSMVPLVQQEMEAFFGADKLLRKMHPKHCVAMGAALVAARIGERVVCADPDCGHVNAPDAESCEQCGAALGSLTATAGGEQEGERMELGGIAPFHYGIVDGEGRFHRFVAKNDPYPTEEPEAKVFRTRLPGQRIISMPYYGRPHAESDENAEKQGDAFSMLPPDLAKGTRIRIRLGLDAQGVMGDPEITLENGTRLRPWITRGEKDAKAVQILEEMERVAGEKAAVASPEELKALEEARRRAFDGLLRMHEEGSGDAIAEAERVLEMARSIGDVSTRQQAENASSNVDYILQTYAPLIPPPLQERAKALVADTRAALESGQSAGLEGKVQALNDVVQKLPDVVKLLFGIKARIASKVIPVDPGQGQALLAEMEELEGALKRNDMGAATRATDLLSRATAAIEAAEAKRRGTVPCPRCGTPVPTGQRYCGNCNSDLWAV